MALPKWTDERTAQLHLSSVTSHLYHNQLLQKQQISLETAHVQFLANFARWAFDVELASASATRAFSDAQEATLASFVSDNSGQYTYADIAGHFEDGAFSPKSIQGKILSMELTGHVKPAPKVEAVKTYTDAEEVTFVELVNGGSFVEEIAEALGKSVNSVRGKALSLLRAELITAIPKQKETKGSSKADPLADLADIAGMTVEQIADAIGKTARGVKTMLTRRGLVAADYDGASKKEKASA